MEGDPDRDPDYRYKHPRLIRILDADCMDGRKIMGKLYTIKDLANKTKLTESVVNKLVRKGEIKATKCSRFWFIEEEEAKRFINSQQKPYELKNLSDEFMKILEDRLNFNNDILWDEITRLNKLAEEYGIKLR